MLPALKTGVSGLSVTRTHTERTPGVASGPSRMVASRVSSSQVALAQSPEPGRVGEVMTASWTPVRSLPAGVVMGTWRYSTESRSMDVRTGFLLVEACPAGGGEPGLSGCPAGLG